MEQTISVIHDQEQCYFKINIGNHCAYLAYTKLADSSIDIYRTFVPEELRGRGLAAKLAEAALTFAEQQDLKIIPSCSYVESYMKKMECLS